MEHETRKKKEKEKSNQWSILKDHKRNCLCLSFLSCQSSIDLRMNDVFALRSAKNRISSTCASIVSSKREIHRAICHKNGERIERETIRILLSSLMANSMVSRIFRLIRRSLKRFSASYRRGILKSWHAYLYTDSYGTRYTYKYAFEFESVRCFTGYQDDSWKDRGNLVRWQ